jgi:hypothetical protein
VNEEALAYWEPLSQKQTKNTFLSRYAKQFSWAEKGKLSVAEKVIMSLFQITDSDRHCSYLE